jgi:hypothetical protein
VLDDPPVAPEAVVLEAVVLEAVVLEAVLLEAVLLEAVVLEAVVLEAVVLEAVVLEAVVLEGAGRVVGGRVVVVRWPVAADLGVAPPPQPARTRANAAGTVSAAHLLTALRPRELFGLRSVGTGTGRN